MVAFSRYPAQLLISALLITLSCIGGADAQEMRVAELSQQKKSSAIQKFFQNIAPKFKEAQQGIQEVGSQNSTVNVLPEGEVLFLTARLPQRLRLEGIIFAQSRNSKIAVSLKDFVQVLFLPIDIDLETGLAKGWYIRENKKFEVDLKARTAKTDQGEFEISDDVFVEDEDVFVPIDELEQWLDFEIRPRIAGQEILIIPSQLLPFQEQMERKKKNRIAAKAPKPKLPTTDFPKRLIDVPVVDVTTNTSYSKDGDTGRSDNRYNASVTTRGDFAYGTLTTRSLLDKEEKLRSVQANYKQESKEPNLLGPLKARRYEIGDVTTASLPLGNTAEQDLGFRVTNKDPLRTLTRPSSVISGTTFPGWDVELYRGNQFLALQSVDENGFFSFDNVDLFSQDNNFRLVFYGPQGELREELVSVPVDTGRLSNSTGIYDVSLTFEDEQAYLADRSSRNQDSGSVNINALYEKPLGSSSAASFGFSTDRGAGTRNFVGQAGFSTLLDKTLYNLNIAVDDELETNAEFAARRSFGRHNVNATTSWIGSGFDFKDADEELEESILQQSLSAVGPLPFVNNDNARYSANSNFRETSDGQTSLNTNLGVNARWNGLTFNELLAHQTSDALEEDRLALLSTVSGAYGKNRIRANANYEIRPERQLSNVFVNFVHEVSNDLDIRAELERDFRPSLTQGSLSMDWQAGFARLSPRVEYNSDNDVFVGLGTRFSALREPRLGDVLTVDRNISGNGGFSAFVYLDENGNRKLDENEKPLEGVIVKSLQNGGIEETDENGIALFTNLVELKLTDVVIEERSLADPLWIPGYEGLSVLPRAGYYAEAEFPIHIAGELDGSVFGERANGQKTALKNVGVELYNLNGKLQETAVTDLGGFYFFSRVPPGTYYLTINEKSADVKNFARPLPEKIEIGYDGTLIFGKDIIVQSGKKDVPTNFVSGYETLKKLHPHVSFDGLYQNIVLNLGQYNSQMRMGLVWYKLRKIYPALMLNAALLIEPEESYADPKTGQHSLRLGLNSWSIDKAYEQCAQLIRGGYDCKVEIMPLGSDIYSAKELPAKAG